ncbi:hypothetical protein [Clostridium tertium]
MKYRINNFRNLKCYERSLRVYKNIVEKDSYNYEEAQNIRYGLAKVMTYLAKSTGDGLYINSVKEDLRRAIKWSDYTIRFLNYEDKLEVIVIKRMIVALRKRG